MFYFSCRIWGNWLPPKASPLYIIWSYIIIIYDHIIYNRLDFDYYINHYMVGHNPPVPHVMQYNEESLPPTLKRLYNIQMVPNGSISEQSWTTHSNSNCHHTNYIHMYKNLTECSTTTFSTLAAVCMIDKLVLWPTSQDYHTDESVTLLQPSVGSSVY